MFSFALAFLIGATFGRHLNLAALALISVSALLAATIFAGFSVGILALIGLQTGTLAGQAAFLMQDSDAAAEAGRPNPKS